jgi:bifunctional DNase/RNase
MPMWRRSSGTKFLVVVEVRLSAVRVDLQSNTPVVLLQETEGAQRSLPIFIGPPEATAIALALQGITPPRPMTHDLMRDLLEALEANVTRVVVTEVRDSTFYAVIHLQVGARTLEISSRPSDAIALATRTSSPLFVSDELMDAEGMLLDPDPDDDETPESDSNPDELVGEFRQFLEQVRPEDFSP